ncbi:MAG TPA: metallophosphoesterase [Blastocatellia bacterium]|nr:metallophosphoesterase [Blastocatellia bacterium]
MRILAVSDLHTDFRENMRLVEGIPDSSHGGDILIVAGDVADRIEVIKRTLSLLRSKFKMVFYTPGNHEMWVRSEEYDSIEKLSRILRLCESLDVRTTPTRVGDIWVVPLFSWYDSEFDPDTSDNDLEAWADFHFCKWPKGIQRVSEYFFKLNLPNIKFYDGPVISFSHFLPRIELLPSKNFLRFKGLPKVAGCKLLESQIRQLKSVTHLFGHSHINRDCVIDGVRYVQNALSYPRERYVAGLSLKEIWDFKRRCGRDDPGVGRNT